MTPIGINNGNFRNGDYLEWAAQDLSSVPTWDQLMEEKKVKEAYGEGWEEDADNIHALIAAAEAGDFDPRTEWERDWDDYCAEVQATRESDAPRGW